MWGNFSSNTMEILLYDKWWGVREGVPKKGEKKKEGKKHKTHKVPALFGAVDGEGVGEEGKAKAGIESTWGVVVIKEIAGEGEGVLEKLLRGGGVPVIPEVEGEGGEELELFSLCLPLVHHPKVVRGLLP